MGPIASRAGKLASMASMSITPFANVQFLIQLVYSPQIFLFPNPPPPSPSFPLRCSAGEGETRAGSMSNPAVNSDMFELKLRKKLLAQQLSVLDDKVDRMSRILEAKKKAKSTGVPSLSLPPVPKKSFFDREIEVVKKTLMVPQPIEPGSSFDMVRKRNLLRRHNALLSRQPAPKAPVARCDPFKINTDVPASFLPRRYTRGELPCTVEHCSNGLALSWMCPLHNLDYSHYLPIFMDGVRCCDNPAKFIARQGVKELLQDAAGDSQRVVDCLDALILPIRHALSSKIPDVVSAVLDIFKQLCLVHPAVGPHLLPHYRQILGILNLFYCKGGKNLGDEMDYGQYKSDDLVVTISETLELLEKTGGKGAFEGIKFCVPTYTSCFVAL